MLKNVSTYNKETSVATICCFTGLQVNSRGSNMNYLKLFKMYRE